MKIDTNETYMEDDMEIELLISSTDTNNQKEVSRLSYADADITVGPLLLDTVKLESHKLQGRRAKFVQSWDADTGLLKLVLSCTAHSQPIEVDGVEISNDDYRIIDESSKIRMGEYRIRARLNAALGTGPPPEPENIEQENDQFELVSFSPEEMELNKPPRSKLYQKINKQIELAYKEPSVADVNEEEVNPVDAKTSISNQLDKFTEQDTDSIEYIVDDERSAETIEHHSKLEIEKHNALDDVCSFLVEPSERTETTTTNANDKEQLIDESDIPFHYEYEMASSYDELCTQSIEDKASRIEASINNANANISMQLVPLDRDNSQPDEDSVVSHKTENQMPEVSDGQVLFNKIVGSDNILDLDFQALKLLTIAGRITHRDEALVNVTISAGPLGKCQTNDDGYFAFYDVVEGTKYNISVQLKGYELKGSERLSGTLYQSLDMNLSTTKLCKVSGRIMHLGKPLAGVKLDAGPFGVSHSDEHGLYVFHNIPEDCTLRIKATCSGYQFNIQDDKSTVAPKNSKDSQPIPLRPKQPIKSISQNNNNDDLSDSLALLMSR